MKHLVHYFKGNYNYEITTMPEPSLGIVVVIPCFNEPDISASILALAKADKPNCAVEVIVVINYGEQVCDDIKQNCLKNYTEVCELSAQLSKPGFTIYPVLKKDLPPKTAGVGLARKTGMDEAAHRFMQINKPQGLILCFDADSACDNNYFTEIEKHPSKNNTAIAGSIYYEHPLNGNTYTEDIYSGIVQYELHLRYYNQATRLIGLPYAYHTVGSSMFCTASAYAKVGGMNKRKAGEDFYFLQKLIPLGNFTEINTTRVIPSPRISDRVPFGTGRAMMKFMEDKLPQIHTYSFESFLIIKELVEKIPDLFRADYQKQTEILNSLHPYLNEYLIGLDYYNAIDELNNNSADYTAFSKRFFRWFDAFRTLKFLNWVHEECRLKKQPIINEANKLLSTLKNEHTYIGNAKAVLKIYRQIERK